MNVKVEEIMSGSVVTTEPHKSIDHVRGMMGKNKVSAIPIINTDGEAVGIVSSTDLVSELNGSSPVSKLMTDKVYTVPKYDDVSTAARVMRNHHIPHARRAPGRTPGMGPTGRRLVHQPERWGM